MLPSRFRVTVVYAMIDDTISKVRLLPIGTPAGSRTRISYYDPKKIS
jgi:hypothetical protein